MEPILDEVSLRPCTGSLPPSRIRRLADCLKALDSLGASRVLRCVRDAGDRNIQDGLGLRDWCFRPQVDRDSGRLVALRLGKAPYVDGGDGLFTAAEGDRVVHSSISNTTSLGAGLAALTDGLLVFLYSVTWPPAKPIFVELRLLSDDTEWIEQATVDAVDSDREVEEQRVRLLKKVDASVRTGSELVERLADLCPRVNLGEQAHAQLTAMTGSEKFFPQIVRHLRALSISAEAWSSGPFEPAGLTYSPESEATLNHGQYGPLRDFPVPDDFASERWSLHTKPSGGPGMRIYYRVQAFEVPMADGHSVQQLRVAIGYVGPHLPTVKFN